MTIGWGLALNMGTTKMEPASQTTPKRVPEIGLSCHMCPADCCRAAVKESPKILGSLKNPCCSLVRPAGASEFGWSPLRVKSDTAVVVREGVAYLPYVTQNTARNLSRGDARVSLRNFGKKELQPSPDNQKSVASESNLGSPGVRFELGIDCFRSDQSVTETHPSLALSHTRLCLPGGAPFSKDPDPNISEPHRLLGYPAWAFVPLLSSVGWFLSIKSTPGRMDLCYTRS